MPIDLPPPSPPPAALVSEHVLNEDRLVQRGAVLLGEALADWTLLAPDGRAASLSGLAGTLITINGLRLTPSASGSTDLSLIPLAWLTGGHLVAGPAGVRQGAGALAGVIDLDLAPADAGNRAWAFAGAQSGQGIAGIDARVGNEAGWIGGGFTQGGALAGPVGLAASGQGRWHLGGHFAQDLAGATITGRALLATRRDGAEQADYHDVALTLAGGTAWQWTLAVATGAHVQPGSSSRQKLIAAAVRHTTGLALPGAVDPVSFAFGGELRRLRLGATVVTAREAFATATLPLLQDRPAAENLVMELGLRQAWLAGRSEPLWSAAARWEFFPGLALRGQVARGIDDPGTFSGVGRSIGLLAVPAFLPGVALAIDWRDQSAGPARIRAIDASLSVRRRLGDSAQLIVNAMATHHSQAEFTPVPVARFQSLLRIGVERGGWTVSTGWRHRSSLAGEPARSALDASVERRLTDKVRLVASLSNANSAGTAPVGRQALLQLVAGF
jgi:hypothetical protein